MNSMRWIHVCSTNGWTRSVSRVKLHSRNSSQTAVVLSKEQVAITWPNSGCAQVTRHTDPMWTWKQVSLFDHTIPPEQNMAGKELESVALPCNVQSISILHPLDPISTGKINEKWVGFSLIGKERVTLEISPLHADHWNMWPFSDHGSRRPHHGWDLCDLQRCSLLPAWCKALPLWQVLEWLSSQHLIQMGISSI